MSARKLRDQPGKAEREHKRKKAVKKTATSDDDGSDDDNLFEKARVRKGTKAIIVEDDDDELQPAYEDDEESASDEPTEENHPKTPKAKDAKAPKPKRKPTSAIKKPVVDEDNFLKGRPSPLCSSMCGH